MKKSPKLLLLEKIEWNKLIIIQAKHDIKKAINSINQSNDNIKSLKKLLKNIS